MKKFIVHLSIRFVTDARNEDEAKKIAEGVCESKNINPRCYKIASVYEAKNGAERKIPEGR